MGEWVVSVRKVVYKQQSKETGGREINSIIILYSAHSYTTFICEFPSPFIYHYIGPVQSAVPFYRVGNYGSVQERGCVLSSMESLERVITLLM